MIVELVLLGLGFLGWAAYSLYKKQSDHVRIFFWPALMAKLLAGAAVGVLYFYYYGQGDTISYWEDGQKIGDLIVTDPVVSLKFFWNEEVDPTIVDGLNNIKPRSLFFVKVSGVLAFFGGGNYWIMAILISFLSFLGSWYLFIRTIGFFPASRVAAAVAFLFYPSVVFWSSGLIKESLGLSALFFLAGIMLTISYREKLKWWEWLLIPLSLWIGWNLKYYWLGVFIPVAITTMIIILLREKFDALARWDMLAWIGLFIVVFLLGTSVHPNFYPNRFLEVIVQNNGEFMALTNPVNAVLFDNLSATWSSVVRNSPMALVAGFFRPFMWEGHNVISYLAGIENFIFLALVIMALPALARLPRSKDRLLGMAVIFYSTILAVFLALSTPNFGTLSRYKTGFIPFLVFLIVFKNPFVARWFQKRSLPGA